MVRSAKQVKVLPVKDAQNEIYREMTFRLYQNKFFKFKFKFKFKFNFKFKFKFKFKIQIQIQIQKRREDQKNGSRRGTIRDFGGFPDAVLERALHMKKPFSARVTDLLLNNLTTFEIENEKKKLAWRPFQGHTKDKISLREFYIEDVIFETVMFGLTRAVF